MKNNLPKDWCVYNDGSEEFYKVLAYMNRLKDGSAYVGSASGFYYGILNNKTAYELVPFGQLLTLEQFKEMSKPMEKCTACNNEFINEQNCPLCKLYESNPSMKDFKKFDLQDHHETIASDSSEPIDDEAAFDEASRKLLAKAKTFRFKLVPESEPVEKTIFEEAQENVKKNHVSYSVDEYNKALGNSVEETPKLDLPTLKYIHFMFGCYSDMSSKCQGYDHLERIIEKEKLSTTPQKNPAKEIVDWLEGVKKSTDSEVLIDVYDSIIQDIRKFWLSTTPEPKNESPEHYAYEIGVVEKCNCIECSSPEPKEK